MMLADLTLTDFRNHADLRLEAGAGMIALHGENGAGKTNILEAISLLAPGRGLRRAALPEMIRDGAAGGFAVHATLTGGDGLAPVALGTGVDAGQPGRRVVRINGAPAAATSLADWVAVLWLTPAMDRLFQEAAGNRRRFLDRLVLALHPAHAFHSGRLDAALRARGKLLSDDGQVDRAWLASLDAQIAEHGAAVDAARMATLAALGQELADWPDQPFARPALALIDADGVERHEPWSAAALAAMLDERRAIDLGAGRTTRGPHRDDMQVRHAATGRAAAGCSTGEQKAMLLSIVLAHSDLVARARGQRPIILLDEVAAHLDPLRRAALYERLSQQGGQAWLTGTEPSLFADAPGAVARHAIARCAPG